jgi:hypothetical protein
MSNENCLLTGGFTLDCNEGVGGVKEIFLCNWEDLESGVTLDGTTGEVNALPSPLTLFRYQPNRNTGALTMTPNVNLENGTLYFSQVVEFMLGKMESDKHKELVKLAKAKVGVFVRMYTDQILFVGRTDGAFLTAGSFQTGKAKGDANGYSVTLTAEEPELAPFCEPYASVPFDNFAGVTISPSY